MSIPQICPSCGNHITTAHAADCCYGTAEYTHLGWPSSDEITFIPQRVLNDILMMGDDTAIAIRRLLDYLQDEPEEGAPKEQPPSTFTTHAVLVLTKRAEELRKEAAGISLIESRAKRIFAADILENLIQELTE